MRRSNNNGWILELAIATVLIALILICRLLIETPNFQPVMAVALFAGFFFTRRWMAMAIPVLGMLISDVFFFGSYSIAVMAVVYLALALPWMLGGLIKLAKVRNAVPLAASVAASSLVSAAFFFLATNLATWALLDWYETTAQGLLACFVAAVPFFKWTLAGNLLFGLGIFGVYHGLTHWSESRQPANSRRVALKP